MLSHDPYKMGPSWDGIKKQNKPQQNQFQALKCGESWSWIMLYPHYELFGLQNWRDQSCRKMDSEVQRDGRILDLIDDAWREDKLPYEDVAIPLVGRDNEPEV